MEEDLEKALEGGSEGRWALIPGAGFRVEG